MYKKNILVEQLTQSLIQNKNIHGRKQRNIIFPDFPLCSFQTRLHSSRKQQPLSSLFPYWAPKRSAVVRKTNLSRYLKRRGLFRTSSCQYFQIVAIMSQPGNSSCVCNRKSSLQYIFSDCIQTWLNVISNWRLWFESLLIQLQIFHWFRTCDLQARPCSVTICWWGTNKSPISNGVSETFRREKCL